MESKDGERMSYETDFDTRPVAVDRTPSTVIGSTRFPMVRANDDVTDLSPRLPAQSAAQVIQSILSAPAPVPQREPAAVRRERIEGANEKSTPIMRAVASVIRSAKYLALVVVLGMVVYVAVPSVSGIAVTGLTVVGMAIVMLVFDALEYRHSQAGVERLRTNVDHKLENLHEQNRHTETMAAIEGDIEIKLRVLNLAAGNRQLADRQQRLLEDR